MTDKSISPLRRRFIEDMTVRGFTPATQRGYACQSSALNRQHPCQVWQSHQFGPVHQLASSGLTCLNATCIARP
jgi:hypothetical protein